ncbi:heavy metal-binding domain-containing protein [Actinospica durhamensis]|uniref:Heavy metal-binding domain-containing protein n=1 Tax=Actinospica durhamensis TaxID=1508375 RepID=A0A941EVF1_9ACTN|nr:heavy metal-binding domain-containing protein [Actinospica durhamensis]MBR7839015.1 heavy metal-binding domain-containing protein [Actinospica durhamensis]
MADTDAAGTADPAVVIAARLERLRRAGAWSSSGPVSDFAATKVSGFEPAGQVFAATVLHLGYTTSRARCTGSWAYTPRTDLAGSGGPFHTLLRRQYGARRTVLARAVAECEALGADGVIGIRIKTEEYPAGGTAITLEGLAVRARSSTRPARPFTTHVTAQDFARLLDQGWMPFELVTGIAIASRHDDKNTRQQTRRGLGLEANREITGYSHLVNDARRDARNQLRLAVEACGGDGVVVGAMTLTISERECPTNEGQHDHIANTTVAGTAIVRLPADLGTPPRRPLTIMRLDPRTRPDPVVVAHSPAVPTENEAATASNAPDANDGESLITRDEKAPLTDRVANRMAARQRRKDVFRSDNTD